MTFASQYSWDWVSVLTQKRLRNRLLSFIDLHGSPLTAKILIPSHPYTNTSSVAEHHHDVVRVALIDNV